MLRAAQRQLATSQGDAKEEVDSSVELYKLSASDETSEMRMQANPLSDADVFHALLLNAMRTVLEELLPPFDPNAAGGAEHADKRAAELQAALDYVRASEAGEPIDAKCVIQGVADEAAAAPEAPADEPTCGQLVSLPLENDAERAPEALEAVQPAAVVDATAAEDATAAPAPVVEPGQFFTIQESVTGQCVFFDAEHRDAHGDYALRAAPCALHPKFLWAAAPLDGDLAARGFTGLTNNGRVLDMPGHGMGPWAPGQLVRGYHTQTRDPDQRVQIERVGEAADGAAEVRLAFGDLGTVWTYNAGLAASDGATPRVVEQRPDEGRPEQTFVIRHLAAAPRPPADADEAPAPAEAAPEEAAPQEAPEDDVEAPAAGEEDEATPDQLSPPDELPPFEDAFA